MSMFQSRTVSLALLITMCVYLSSVSANYRRPSKVTTNCCTSVSDTPIKSELQGYRIQNSMPPCVNAIIFYTVKGEKICSDPKTLWVDRRKKGLKVMKK
ncbi:eotaxin-like [Oncorhynchus nerka]|uniref:eotaxin-like n=1 Tax=Oncorhynchus nerka TaxID=8023 RepID=UPI00113196BE|nr:eotaxin-like [Oncorhynchus nerka]XP_046148671.1 eotaxin-like [Oncorhynchus gorbuscha]XP_052339614.1 eotaxin [Oncorhynchus keta]